MYEVVLISDGTARRVDSYRDFTLARAAALEASRSGGVYAVVRVGFGKPIIYCVLGQALDDYQAMQAVSAPTIEPVRPEDEGDEPGDEEPRPRRRRKTGPAEVKAKAAAPAEYKQFQVAVDGIDEEQGIVTAIVNVFGIIDDGDDIIHNGAFIKTLAENGHRVKVLNSHNTRSALDVVGRPLSIREIGREELPAHTRARWPEATGGLLTETQYLINTPEGRGIFERIKAGAVNEYSIGFDALQADNTKVETRDGKSKLVRNIRQIRLWEYSPCVFGMNPGTSSVSVKTVPPFADLPLADRERAWDADAAEGRVRAWAGGDEPDWGKYRRAFFWYDEEDAETFGAYKLGFADVVDGELTAIPRAVFAVAAVLQGGRGGVDLPAGDEAAVKNRVERYYAKMREQFEDDGIVVPWQQDGKAAVEGEGGAEPEVPTPALPLVGAWLVEQMQIVAQSLLAGLHWSGLLNEVEHADLTELCAEHLTAIGAAIVPDIGLRPMRGGYFVMSREAGEDKAGPTLAPQTYSMIKQASDMLTVALSTPAAGPQPDGGAEGKAAADAAPDDPGAHAAPEQTQDDGPHATPETPTSPDEAGPSAEDDAPSAAELLSRIEQALAELGGYLP